MADFQGKADVEVPIDIDDIKVTITEPPPEKHWRCQLCQRPVPSYMGRCPGCSRINTLRVAAGPCPALPKPKQKMDPIQPFAGLGSSPMPMVENDDGLSVPIGEVETDFEPVERMPTGVTALDRVLGKHDPGAARGSVILFGGEPGVQKSTLALQAMAGIAERGETVIYASGEQMKFELVEYAQRLGLMSDAVREHLRVIYTTSYDTLAVEIEDHDPVAVVIDSLAVFSTFRVEGRPGSPAHAIAIMKALYELVVERKIAAFVVSHVTKDSSLAGPKTVQHAAHVVAQMRLISDVIERCQLEAAVGSDCNSEGEPWDFVEIVCPTKNRYGKRKVPGYFVVGESGLLQSLDVQPPGIRRRRFAREGEAPGGVEEDEAAF